MSNANCCSGIVVQASLADCQRRNFTIVPCMIAHAGAAADKSGRRNAARPIAVHERMRLAASSVAGIVFANRRPSSARREIRWLSSERLWP
jgi:hypothetical protein